MDFQTMWSEKTKSALILIKEETVEFLDMKILECYAALKTTRMKAIQSIGKGSKKADDALSEFNKRTKAIKESFDKLLLKFSTHIRTPRNRPSYPPRKKHVEYKFKSKNHGRKYRPY